MRILYIIPEEYNGEHWGGVTSYVVSLAKELNTNKHENKVEVLTPGKSNKDFISRGIEFHQRVVKTPRFAYLFPDVVFRICWAWEVLTYIKARKDFDVIEAPEWGSSTIFLPFFGISAIVRLHRSWLQYIQDNNWPITLSIRVMDIFERWCILSASAVSSPTHFMISKYPIIRKILLFRKVPVVTVKNGVQIYHLKYKMPKNKFLLLSGRIEPGKGCELLVLAFAKIHKFYPSLKLYFVGEDTNFRYNQKLISYTSYLKNETVELNLQSKVKFIARQPFEKLLRYYKDCHIYISASAGNENCSMSILEAMSVGKAIIGSKTGGTPELIIHGKNGLLFKSNSVDDLAGKIKYLMDNPKQRARFEHYNLTNYSSFNIKDVARKSMEFYKSCSTKKS